MVRMSRTRRVRPLRLDGGGLVGAPHGAVEGDVPLDEGGAEGDRGEGGLQAGLVAAVADRDVRVLVLQGVDHPQVELLGLGRVGRRGVAEQDVVAAQDLDGVPDLLGGGHARREDDGAAGGAHGAQQLVVGQRGGGDLVAGHVELLQEGDGLDVPRGGEPGDAALLAVLVDGAVAVLVELHAVAVVDVGHPAPRGVALDVPLVARGADLRGPLLELDGVAAGVGGGVDQGERVLQVAVVVDADLAGDVDGAAGAGLAVAEGAEAGGVAHGEGSFCVGKGCAGEIGVRGCRGRGPLRVRGTGPAARRRSRGSRRCRPASR